MRIFLTGATGFVGSRVMLELLARGHEVVGMTRSDDRARVITAAGAIPHLATLENLDDIAAGAAEADAVIHTAFDHDFNKFTQNCEKDSRVIAALGAAVRGSERPLMVTSGTGMGDGGDCLPATEAIFNADNVNPRVASEIAVERLLDDGINAKVMRLPQVHNTLRQGLITLLIQISLQKGSVAVVGQGQNRWPAAHVQDVAELFALAFNKGVPGTRYHAVSEQGIPLRTIADALSERLKLPLVFLTPEETSDYFGWFAPFASLDMPASSDWTRAQLGWQPKGPDLISDLKNLRLE